MDQTNSGSRFQVSPGALILWIVTMKLRPVRMDEKPITNTPAVTNRIESPTRSEYGRRLPCRLLALALGQRRGDFDLEHRCADQDSTSRRCVTTTPAPFTRR